MEISEARKNLPKVGPAIYMRICKSGIKCNYNCEHKEPHIVSLLCNLKCCDVQGKNVRCVAIETENKT